MAISFKKYIDITSAVGGATLVSFRELIGRVFTTNNILPPGSQLEFNEADQVGSYFGTDSEEYARAVPYFSFISKSITSAKKISFARWVDANVAPLIFGHKNVGTSLAQFQSITDGSFEITIGPVTHVISGLDFSTALSLADVATIIQAAINLQVGIMWTAAVVSYDVGRGTFDFVGGDTSTNDEISVDDGGVGTEIRNLIGWNDLAIFAKGGLQETLTETLQKSADSSNNFGSFTFQETLTIEEHKEIAEWNELQNVMFIYHKPGLIVNAAGDFAAIGEIGGTLNTISEIAEQYPEMYVMAAQAATRYDRANSVINYMYQIFPGLTASVSDTLVSDQLDPVRANYYGNTQTAGQVLNFYQTGFLYGSSTDPINVNTYANEIWFKDAVGVEIMQLFLSQEKVSANAQGRVKLLTVIQHAINQALSNGTISTNKKLNESQKLFISNITNDQDSWRQVQSSGYWKNVDIVQSGIEFIAEYTLIYSKDDIIRRVKGAHVLI